MHATHHAGSKGWLAGMCAGELRRKIARAPYDALWARLERRTRAVMRLARESNFTLGYGCLAWHSNTPMVMEAALLHRLGGDADALRYVEECIRRVDDVARGRRKPAPEGKLPALSHGELALAADLCRDTLGRDARAALLALMREVCIDFHRGSEPCTGFAGGNNIAWCQTVNAALCALAWGADCGHPGWEEVVDNAVLYARCYLRRGCDAQGYGYEGTGYSYSVFHYMYLFAQLLHQNARLDLFASEDRLRRVIDATFTLLLPDRGALANINDHGLLHPESMSWLLYTAKHYRDPLQLGLWYAYQGPDHARRPYGDVMPWYRSAHGSGDPDAAIDQRAAMLQAVLYWDAHAPHTPLEQTALPLANYAPGTETANFRTSWGRDAVYVNFLGAGRSHASQTHRHADCGHFSVFAHGEYLAIDTGRYNANEDQHNVVLVDGACHRPCDRWGMSDRAGRLSRFERSPLLDYACADMAHMKDCNWAERHLLFVRLDGNDCYLIVIDNINKDNRKHGYLWQLHAHPGCAVELEAPGRARVNGDKARLDVSFHIPSAEDFPDDPHTLALRVDEAWWSWPYGKEAAPPFDPADLMITSVRRPRLLAEVTGLNGQLMAVIAPRRAGLPPLTVRDRSVRRHLVIDVRHGTGTDTVIAALDHGCILVGEASGFAELALVRRNPDGRIVAQWTESGETLGVA